MRWRRTWTPPPGNYKHLFLSIYGLPTSSPEEFTIDTVNQYQLHIRCSLPLLSLRPRWVFAALTMGSPFQHNSHFMWCKWQMQLQIPGSLTATFKCKTRRALIQPLRADQNLISTDSIVIIILWVIVIYPRTVPWHYFSYTYCTWTIKRTECVQLPKMCVTCPKKLSESLIPSRRREKGKNH